MTEGITFISIIVFAMITGISIMRSNIKWLLIGMGGLYAMVILKIAGIFI